MAGMSPHITQCRQPWNGCASLFTKVWVHVISAGGVTVAAGDVEKPKCNLRSHCQQGAGHDDRTTSSLWDKPLDSWTPCSVTVTANLDTDFHKTRQTKASERLVVSTD